MLYLHAIIHYHTHTQQDSNSPTFPLYTEVMGKGQPMGDEGEVSPELPQKTLTDEDLKELELPTAEEIPVLPPQNLTTDSEYVQHSIEVLMFTCQLPHGE